MKKLLIRKTSSLAFGSAAAGSAAPRVTAAVPRSKPRPTRSKRTCPPEDRVSRITVSTSYLVTGRLSSERETRKPSSIFSRRSAACSSLTSRSHSSDGGGPEGNLSAAPPPGSREGSGRGPSGGTVNTKGEGRMRPPMNHSPRLSRTGAVPPGGAQTGRE